jgi:hypothetical protein
MIWDNEVVGIMKPFIQYLRMQGKLIAQMQATWPQLSTRWLVMGIVSAWLLSKYLTLMDHLNTAKKPVAEAPPPWWWVVIAGIRAMTDIINPIITRLQSTNLLVGTQAAIWFNCVTP